MTKPHSKTQKKIDNNIRIALTEVCEQLLTNTPGFQWLTHQANYSNFPASLLITCVFDTRANQQQTRVDADLIKIQKLIQQKLLKIGIKFKTLQQIMFDSEEACAAEHEGNWVLRLAGREQPNMASSRSI